jgi:hypothetical protein
MQLEEKNVDETEGITLRIICAESFAHEATEKEQVVQLGFDSVIRCHDPCAMELINHAAVKIRIT